MKKYTNGFNLFIYFCMLVLLSSCTKGFDDLNTDKTKIETLAPKQLDKLFSSAEYGGILNTDQWGGGYQLLISLASDEQSQFFSCTQKAFPSDRNAMVGRWINGGWGAFLNGASTLQTILDQTGPNSPSPRPLEEAVAKVWKSYIFIPMTDFFGPIPYSNIGNGQDVVEYDSQEFIYTDIAKSLGEAIAVLAANQDKKVFETGDVIYGGDCAKWLKFANSIRLRAAIRISKVNPSLAKSEAEAAFSGPGGLITTNADNASQKPTPPGYLNPLGVISEWGEFRMSASMSSVLMGYEDPRMSAIFQESANGGYKGLRNGLTIAQMSESFNDKDNNSNVASRFQNGAAVSEPFTIYAAAETWFNLAEAKLNGWNVGSSTAQQLYEGGITASMNQWGFTGGAVTSYISSLNTPAPFDGPDEYKAPPLSDITVAWAATEEKQREQIATQKWIGLCPTMSTEAWAEFRRTGYPKLYARIDNENPDASTDAGSVKRLIFPPSEAVVNKTGYDGGVSKLGGPDKSSTALWWDN
jgi:hypothetical protein